MPTGPGEQFFTRSRSVVSPDEAGETLIVTARKLYQEPEFRHERVFETMALTCGKISATDFMCTHVRKTS